MTAPHAWSQAPLCSRHGSKSAPVQHMVTCTSSPDNRACSAPHPVLASSLAQASPCCTPLLPLLRPAGRPPTRPLPPPGPPPKPPGARLLGPRLSQGVPALRGLLGPSGLPAEACKTQSWWSGNSQGYLLVTMHMERQAGWTAVQHAGPLQPRRWQACNSCSWQCQQWRAGEAARMRWHSSCHAWADVDGMRLLSECAAPLPASGRCRLDRLCAKSGIAAGAGRGLLGPVPRLSRPFSRPDSGFWLLRCPCPGTMFWPALEARVRRLSSAQPRRREHASPLAGGKMPTVHQAAGMWSLMPCVWGTHSSAQTAGVACWARVQ